MGTTRLTTRLYSLEDVAGNASASQATASAEPQGSQPVADHPTACVVWTRFLKLRHTVPHPTGYPWGSGTSYSDASGAVDPGWPWAFCGDGDMLKGVPGEASSLAGHLWMDLTRVGIDKEKVGKQLETEGVDKFATSYLKIIDIIEAKRAEAGG